MLVLLRLFFHGLLFGYIKVALGVYQVLARFCVCRVLLRFYIIGVQVQGSPAISCLRIHT